MKSSDSIVKISEALLKAQIEMEGAKKGAANPFFKSKYADYGSVLEAVKGPLNNNKIVILQPLIFVQIAEGNPKQFVETMLIHESGEFISSQTMVVCKSDNNPQDLGSAITYARRYGLQSLVALPTEDDDGNRAATAPKKGRAPATSTPAKPAAKVEAKPKEVPKEEPAPRRRRTSVAADDVANKPQPKTETKTDNSAW